jgi:hypothetical protein
MSIRPFIPLALFLSASLSTLACASEQDDEQTFDDTRCEDQGVTCQAYGRAKDAANKAPAYELGTDAKPAKMTKIYQSTAGWEPVDLEFNPKSPRDLWIANYATSHMTVVRDVGTKKQQVVERRDPAYSHFMDNPPAFAMAGQSPQWGQLWAACGDNDNGGNYFMGPTLYSAELNIFGGQNQRTGLGSHLDMLHSSSYCRGIAWAGTGNQYFVFNANNRSVDFYDFVRDHGPGNDDHSDGVIRRFWNNTVDGVDGAVSHLSWNSDEKKLYVADTGNKRILILDPALGHVTAPMRGDEQIAERNYYEAPVKTFVSGGPLQAPAGLEVNGGVAFVTDTKTSQILAFEVGTGKLLRSLDTKLKPGSLAGLNFGPDGKIYFVDRNASAVYRLDP